PCRHDARQRLTPDRPQVRTQARRSSSALRGVPTVDEPVKLDTRGHVIKSSLKRGPVAAGPPHFWADYWHNVEGGAQLPLMSRRPDEKARIREVLVALGGSPEAFDRANDPSRNESEDLGSRIAAYTRLVR